MEPAAMKQELDLARANNLLEPAEADNESLEPATTENNALETAAVKNGILRYMAGDKALHGGVNHHTTDEVGYDNGYNEQL
jgi:hypothetical protein